MDARNRKIIDAASARAFSPNMRMPRGAKILGAPPSYRAAKRGAAGELWLYGVIGSSWWEESISASQVRDDLKALGDVSNIDVHIQSEGGDVFHGVAIYSLLTQHPADINVIVDGLAASAASYIAMAGNTIAMSEPAFMMIHNAWTFAAGNAEELSQVIALLKQVDESIIGVYQARTGNSADQIRAWMQATTWFSAAECEQNGFCDQVIENLKVAASVGHADWYPNTPAALHPRRVAANAAIERMKASMK